MKALVYQLLLLSPVLIAKPGAGEENSDRGYPYITGSVMRGALATRYLNNHEPNEVFRKQFIFGQVRFLNAYPVFAGNRMLPAPLSWHIAKQDKEKDQAKAYDFVYGVPSMDQLEAPKSLGERFVVPNNGGILVASTRMQVTVHNVSKARYIKKKEDSTLFQYEAIAPGQVFCGTILGDESDLALMKTLLDARPDLWLGGSRSAGYGHTTVLDAVIQESWHETDDQLRLTLNPKRSEHNVFAVGCI